MSSLRSLGRAIDYLAARQVALVRAGGTIAQETRHWDEAEGRTSSMRSKEGAYDYRYFPEPDLVPVQPSAESIAAVRLGLDPLVEAAVAAGDGSARRDGVPYPTDGPLLVQGAIEVGRPPACAMRGIQCAHSRRESIRPCFTRVGRGALGRLAQRLGDGRVGQPRGGERPSSSSWPVASEVATQP